MPTSNPETKNSRKLHQDLQDLRSLYQALNRHEPFEKVAAAFNAKDLEFLLTNTNSLKLTYIVDTGDSPRGAALRQWVNAGVIAHLARSAAKGGYTDGADPILTHPADPILTRGWKPTA